MKTNLEKVYDNLETVKNDCEYITDEIDMAEADNYEDAFCYGVSMIDIMIYRLKEVKEELEKSLD